MLADQEQGNSSVTGVGDHPDEKVIFKFFLFLNFWSLNTSDSYIYTFHTGF